MAKAKDKRAALTQWSEQFVDFVKWKDKFLICLSGGLISGICLDETRDPGAYKPTFFFHNLLVDSPVVTLSYAAPYVKNGVYKPVKYGASIEGIVPDFKEQVPALTSGPLTMASFISHVRDAQNGRFGAQAIYVPNFFRDVITLGVCFGDSNYYRQSISDAVSVIKTKPGINMNIIGSAEKWRDDIQAIVRRDCMNVIASHIEKLRLPALEDRGLSVEVIEKYWTFV